MPRVALAKRVHANAVDNLLASTEVFPMTAPKGRRQRPASPPLARRPRPAAFQPAHRPARSGGCRRGGPGDLVGASPRLHRGQVGEPGPGLAPGRRGPGHRHRRPHREERGAPEGKVLRQALFAWAFNPATRDRVPRCPGGEGVDEDHEVVAWRLAGSQAPQHAAAVCLRAARHVRIEGDRVVLVRHAGMQVQLDGHACMAERERVTQAFVAEDVELADLDVRRRQAACVGQAPWRGRRAGVALSCPAPSRAFQPVALSS